MARGLSLALGSLTALLVSCAIANGAETAPRYAPGQLLVKYRPTAKRAARIEAEGAMGARATYTFASGLEQLQLPSGMSVEEAAARMRANPLVEYAEPNYEVHALGVPNDPRFAESWALHNTGQSGGTPGADIHALEAWDTFTGDSTILIGVIDSGVDYEHPDLVDNMWINQAEANGLPGVDDDGNGYVDDVHGYDFYNTDPDPMDDYAHGTAVAGIIAARGNNGIGMAGVCWRAKIVPIKFISATGMGWLGNAIQAIEYATRLGCRVINLSWSIGPTNSSALLDAISAGGAAGELFIAAAGNDGKNIDVSPDYPSSFHSPYVLSVAASDDHDALAGFSNYGTAVDLAAPGVGILTTIAGSHGGGYSTASGTSFAAPHATGVCALLMAQYPRLIGVQIRDLVLATIDGRSALQGVASGGRIDALSAMTARDTTPPSRVFGLSCDAIGTNSIALAWRAPGDDDLRGHASLYDLRYSTVPITGSNFASCIPVPAPCPSSVGTLEGAMIQGLHDSTTYYFAVTGIDKMGNRGPISNVASATTRGRPVMSISSTSVHLTTRDWTPFIASFSINDVGSWPLEWTVGPPRNSSARSTRSEQVAGTPWLIGRPSSGVVGPRSSASIALEIDPRGLTVGSHDGTLVIGSSDPDQRTTNVPVTLTVQGTPSIGAPLVVTFPRTPVGASSNLDVLITNVGRDPVGPLVIQSATIRGTAFGMGGIPSIIDPKSRAWIRLTFTPRADSVSYVDTLTIESNDPAQPTVHIRLFGSSLMGPPNIVAPSVIQFPPTLLNRVSVRRFGVSNSRYAAPLVITGVNISGPPFGISMVPHASPLIINPGDSASFELLFAPRDSPGSYKGGFGIYSNDPRGDLGITLEGLATTGGSLLDVDLPRGAIMSGATVPITVAPASSRPSSHLELWFSPDSGRSWEPAAATPTENGLSWASPSLPTMNAFIEVVARGDSDGSYVASTILGPLNLVSPGAKPSQDAAPIPAPRIVGANPARGRVDLLVTMNEGGPVEATVLDIRGAVVRRLTSHELGRGEHAMTWDGTANGARRAGPGIYFIRVRNQTRVLIKRIVLIP